MLRRLYDRVVDSIALRVLDQTSAADRHSPATKAAVRQLFATYQAQVRTGCPPRLADTGLRVFSEYEEDGLILFLLACCGVGPSTFMDIGAGNCVSGSNVANLAVNLGFHGLFIDGEPGRMKQGQAFYLRHPDTKAYPPVFVTEMVRTDNINASIERAGFTGEVDVLSIDLDGPDYWIWNALEVISPRIVVIETHVEFGMHPVVVPYDPEYVYPGKHPHYHGASVPAMAKLSKKLGYRMVGANRLGFNTFHVRADLAPKLLPEVSPADVLAHPRNAERAKLFDPIADYEYVRT